MVAIVLALGAGLGWGTSDFLGGLKSRKIPLLSVLLLSQATALVLLAVTAAVRGGGLPDPASLGFAAGAGIGEMAGMAALYRGLAVGKMSIVAPVAATAPAVPLLAGLAIGEVPSPLQFTGLALAIIGLVVTSFQTSEDETASRPMASLLYGFLAALGFGMFFLTMDTASEDDIGWALLMAKLTAVTAVATLVIVRRHRLAVPKPELPSVVLIGVLIVTADSLYAIASTLGLVSIVAVLGSLHTVVTMLLARVFLNERLQRIQQIGVALSLLGVLAISAA